MSTERSQLPNISGYTELIDCFVKRRCTAAEFETSFIGLMKSERRVLGEPIYPLLQELFEDTDAYVGSLGLRTESVDLDDERLRHCAARTRQLLRDSGIE